MVSTEILPRCSRVINASSDTACLHFLARGSAPGLLIAASLQHDLHFASHVCRLNDACHFIRRRPRLVARRAKPKFTKTLLPEMRQAPAHQIIRARPFLRQQILRPDALSRLTVDHGKLDEVSGLAVDEPQRRPGISGNRPFIADPPEGLDTENDVPPLE